MNHKNLDSFFCVLAFVGVMVSWYLAIFVAPTEAMMGEAYRIIYVHVPAAAAALGLSCIGLLISSLMCLLRPNANHLISSRAWVEVGFVFTSVVLITGSIWGKTSWGTWWTWDARLTTTLILALLFVGYLVFYQSLPEGNRKVRICGILGIVIFVDMPIVYNSVKWWRTLHQPASIIEQRGETYSSDIFTVLLTCIILELVFAFYLWRVRRRVLVLKQKLEYALT